MKMSKKILPALAMLIVSAVMLSTASFAWFAMSTEVSASNMKVSVKSDSSFLLISQDEADITDPTYTETNVDINNEVTGGIVPVTIDEDKIGDSDLINEFRTSDDIWYTMTGTAEDDGTGVTDSEKYVAAADLAKHTYRQTFYIGLTSGSADMYNLQARFKLASGSEAVNVLVVVDGAYDWLTVSAEGYTSSEILVPIIQAGVATQVDVYVFYNGDHEDITTNKLSAHEIAETTVHVYFKANETASN